MNIAPIDKSGQTLLRKKIMVSSLVFLASMAAATISTSPPCCVFSCSTSISARSRPSKRTESFSSTSPSPSVPPARTAARQASSTASARSPISHSRSAASAQYWNFSAQKPSSYCSLARCLRVAGETFAERRASAPSRADSAGAKLPACRCSSASQACSEITFSAVARKTFSSQVCLARERQVWAAEESERRCRRERSSRTSRYCLLALPKWWRQSCSAWRRRVEAARVRAAWRAGLCLAASLEQQQAAREQSAMRLEWSRPQLYSISSVAFFSVSEKSASENQEYAFIISRQTANSRVYFCGQASSYSRHFLMHPMKSASQQQKLASSQRSSRASERGRLSLRRWKTSFLRFSAASARWCRLQRQRGSLLKDSTSSSSQKGYSRTRGATLQEKKRSLRLRPEEEMYPSATARSSTSRMAPKQCSMKEKSCPAMAGRGGQPDCSSSGAMAGSPLKTRLKKCVSSISPCADRYTLRRCLQKRQDSRAAMISSLGHEPCNVLAARSPLMQRSMDSALVEACSRAAVWRKARSMGDSKTMLWFFSAEPARTMRLRCSLRLSSSRSTPFPLSRTWSVRKPPSAQKENHSGLYPSSTSTLRSASHSSPSTATDSRTSERSKAMQQTPLYSMYAARGGLRLRDGSSFSLRMSIRAVFWQTLNSRLRFLMASSLKKMRGLPLMRMFCVVSTATRSYRLPTSITLLRLCSDSRQWLSPRDLDSSHSERVLLARCLKDSYSEISSFCRSRRQSNFPLLLQLSPKSHSKSHPATCFDLELLLYRSRSLYLYCSISLRSVSSLDLVSILERGVQERSADILLVLNSGRSSTISRAGTIVTACGVSSSSGELYQILWVSEKSLRSLRVFSIEALRSMWSSESEQLFSLIGVCEIEGSSITSSIMGGGELIGGFCCCSLGGSSFFT